MKHLELEFKYPAAITLAKFKKVCEAHSPVASYHTAGGEDLFYSNSDKPDSFFRIRLDGRKDTLELTYKEKKKNNLYLRVEYNLTVDSNNLDGLHSLLNTLGYKFNTYITKDSCTYDFGWYYVCYYTVLRDNQNLGSFIEIEVTNSSLTDLDDAEAMKDLEQLEKQFFPLGIFPETRIKKSLFDIFKA